MTSPPEERIRQLRKSVKSQLRIPHCFKHKLHYNTSPRWRDPPFRSQNSSLIYVVQQRSVLDSSSMWKHKMLPCWTLPENLWQFDGFCAKDTSHRCGPGCPSLRDSSQSSQGNGIFVPWNAINSNKNEPHGFPGSIWKFFWEKGKNSQTCGPLSISYILNSRTNKGFDFILTFVEFIETIRLIPPGNFN